MRIVLLPCPGTSNIKQQQWIVYIITWVRNFLLRPVMFLYCQTGIIISLMIYVIGKPIMFLLTEEQILCFMPRCFCSLSPSDLCAPLPSFCFVPFKEIKMQNIYIFKLRFYHCMIGSASIVCECYDGWMTGKAGCVYIIVCTWAGHTVHSYSNIWIYWYCFSSPK